MGTIKGDSVRGLRHRLAAVDVLAVGERGNGRRHEIGFPVAIGDPELVLVQEGGVGRGKALPVGVLGVGRNAQAVDFLEGAVGDMNLSLFVVGSHDQGRFAGALEQVGPVDVALGESGVAFDHPRLGETIAESNEADTPEAPVHRVLGGVEHHGSVGAGDVRGGGGRDRDEAGSIRKGPEALAGHLGAWFQGSGFRGRDWSGPLDVEGKGYGLDLCVLRVAVLGVMGLEDRRGAGEETGCG